jgi:1-acyl-sn-glycerol-3-phosphate acyltransferase
MFLQGRSDGSTADKNLVVIWIRSKNKEDGIEMSDSSYSLTYPRKRLTRFLIRILGRGLLRVLFRIKITGRENFPKTGPLLVVGNHTAAMEAVLLNIFSPWQIEMLSAADTPAEPITEIVAGLYGVIPLHRGSYDRAALENALDVLSQNGVIGLFPEGGIWQEGRKKALPGIAWLSYRSGAPVLPIGFSETTGAINAGLKLKRPRLTMKVGKLIGPAVIPPDIPRKTYLQSYAVEVMERVHQLVPMEGYHSEPEIIDEWFELELSLKDLAGKEFPIPSRYRIKQSTALAKFLHRPAILKIFKVNLEMPVDSLQTLHNNPSQANMIQALDHILSYLESENPYLLTYRFGVKEGAAMKEGLEELRRLLEWAESNHHRLSITPIRGYYSLKEEKQITQMEQGTFTSWM